MYVNVDYVCVCVSDERFYMYMYIYLIQMWAFNCMSGCLCIFEKFKNNLKNKQKNIPHCDVTMHIPSNIITHFDVIMSGPSH